MGGEASQGAVDRDGTPRGRGSERIDLAREIRRHVDLGGRVDGGGDDGRGEAESADGEETEETEETAENRVLENHAAILRRRGGHGILGSVVVVRGRALERGTAGQPPMTTSESIRDWYCADADEHGFVSWDYVQKQAAGRTKEEFVEAFPVPALMVVYRGVDQAASEGMDPNQSGVQLLTVSVKSAAVLRYLSRVAFVCKRPGNPFGHLVSIGRSGNNDITLAVDSVSKVHGYVVVEGDQRRFTDHGSTNGSRLNGEKLDPSRKVTLESGDVLQLGLEVMLEFLSPETLYERAVAGR